MKRLLFSIIALLLACCMLWGCAPKNDVPDATEPPEPASTDAATALRLKGLPNRMKTGRSLKDPLSRTLRTT